MDLYKITPRGIWATTAVILVMGVPIMTMPNPLQQTEPLPGQVSVEAESSVLARIGVVTDIIESNNITVRISGSNVLVTASYLFPAYAPVLGDYVYLTKQDAQWLVLGTMSGPINSAIENPGFEDGNVGSLPTGWTTNVVSSAGGTPTFTKESAANPIGGLYQAMLRNSSVGAGTSVIDIFSPRTPASEGQRWAMSFFLVYAVVNVNAALVVQSGNTQVQVFIRFLDGTGVSLFEESAYVLYLGSNVITPTYIRTVTTGTGSPPYAIAPPNTSFVQYRIRATLAMNASSATEIWFDQMVLRTPD